MDACGAAGDFLRQNAGDVMDSKPAFELESPTDSLSAWRCSAQLRD